MLTANNNVDSYIKIGRNGTFCIFLLLVFSLFTINPITTFSAVLFVPLAAKLLYRKNEPPFFFVAILLQWLQVTVKVFYSDFYSLSFKSLFDFPDHIYEAYFFSLLGLMAISLGSWVILRKEPPVQLEVCKIEVLQISIKKITTVYIIAILISPFLMAYSFAAGGLQQIIMKIAQLKWSLFFIFFLSTFLKNENKKTFYIIVLVEILLSFTGLFSSFKEYFMVLALGYVMINQTFNFKNIFWLSLIVILLFNFFVVWQHIKPEYRNFLTKGGGSQSVSVEKGDALKKFLQLAGKMDAAGYKDGVARLLERTSYIDFFSASIAYVPKHQAYENGDLWWGSLMHVFMPRIFFPGKPIIDDSKVAMKYTGLKFSILSEGTSITLGYMGETYADFGFNLMLAPLFLFGLALGYIYKYILTTSLNAVWSFALLIPLFFQLNVFEQSLIKLVGGTIAYFIILVIIKKVGLIKYIDRRIRFSANDEKEEAYKKQYHPRYSINS